MTAWSPSSRRCWVRLLLALLIAFNAASSNADERAREHATMVAYGVRVRTLLVMAVVEGSVIGVLGTLLGLGLGVLALGWWMAAVAGDIPELELLVVLTPATIATTLLLGVVVVGVAPLFTVRKLRRMDVPPRSASWSDPAGTRRGDKAPGIAVSARRSAARRSRC